MARQLPRRKSRRRAAERINTAVNAAFTPEISFSCLEIDDDDEEEEEAGSPRGGRGTDGLSLVSRSRTRPLGVSKPTVHLV